MASTSRGGAGMRKSVQFEEEEGQTLQIDYQQQDLEQGKQEDLRPPSMNKLPLISSSNSKDLSFPNPRSDATRTISRRMSLPLYRLKERKPSPRRASIPPVLEMLDQNKLIDMNKAQSISIMEQELEKLIEEDFTNSSLKEPFLASRSRNVLPQFSPSEEDLENLSSDEISRSRHRIKHTSAKRGSIPLSKHKERKVWTRRTSVPHTFDVHEESRFLATDQTHNLFNTQNRMVHRRKSSNQVFPSQLVHRPSIHEDNTAMRKSCTILDNPISLVHLHDSNPTLTVITHIRKGFGMIFILLGFLMLVASLCITYPVIVPMMQRALFSNLTITNSTEGFSSGDGIQDAPNATWYFWNLTNHEDVLAGTGAPMLKQLGPYVVQQKIRTFQVNFTKNDTEVYRSSAMFGAYVSETSCATCSLDDQITIVNSVYLYFTGLYASEYDLLQQYVPNIIRKDLSKIADYLLQHGYATSTSQAKDLSLQQWADCSVLNLASIRQIDSSWYYYPEMCGWAQYVEYRAISITQNDANNILYQMVYAILNYNFGDALAIANLWILAYPRGRTNPVQKLASLSAVQTVDLMDYITYMTTSGAKIYFEDVICQGNGLFMTRSVQEILYGYYDPLLEGYYGTLNKLAFVGAINSFAQLNNPPSDFIESQAFIGFKTGKGNVNEMFNVIQQGTNMGLRAPPVNKNVIQWEHGSIQVSGSSGAFFGPGVVKKGKPQSMWMDLLNRHITFDYVGEYVLQNLEIYKYHMSDSSLEACEQIPLENLDKEGPCLYPQYYTGVFNLTRFSSLFYLTLPHFLRTEPQVKYTLGLAGDEMSVDSYWDVTLEIEPFWGATINVSFMFQNVVPLQRSTVLRPNLWLNFSSSFFPNVMWLPTTIISSQITPNTTLLHTLWISKLFVYGVIFILVYVIPFLSMGCILCGFHFMWKKRQFTCCEKKEEKLHPDILVARVIDPIELQIKQRTWARVTPSFQEMMATLANLKYALGRIEEENLSNKELKHVEENSSREESKHIESSIFVGEPQVPSEEPIVREEEGTISPIPTIQEGGLVSTPSMVGEEKVLVPMQEYGSSFTGSIERRKLSILVEEEQEPLPKIQSPRSFVSPRASMFAGVAGASSIHRRASSFVIEDHHRHSLLQTRKSRHAKSFRVDILEAFVEIPLPTQASTMELSLSSASQQPTTAQIERHGTRETIQRLFQQSSAKDDFMFGEKHESSIGPAWVDDI